MDPPNKFVEKERQDAQWAMLNLFRENFQLFLTKTGRENNFGKNYRSTRVQK